MHPNGQIPAYEWNFSDVNPPVNAYAVQRVYQIDKKLNDLKALRKELSYLANNCHGDDKPNCPILEALSKK